MNDNLQENNSQKLKAKEYDFPKVISTKSNRKSKIKQILFSIAIGASILICENIIYDKVISHSKKNEANHQQQIVINNSDNINVTAAVAKKAIQSVVTIGVSSQNGVNGSGSGIVIDSNEGIYILTNAHVVTADSQIATPDIQVRDNNGKIYNATLVGSDTLSDLAILKTENAYLNPIEFGDSSQLNVGQMAVAIGAPLGLSESVTDGIISSLNRTITIQSSATPDDISSQLQDTGIQTPFKFQLPDGSIHRQENSTIALNVIQTDAAINPGNSGGPLLDEDGKLIGVNVAIASTSNNGSSGNVGNIGVGFSIPVNYAKRIAENIISGNKVGHGYLGASIRDHIANNSKNSIFSDGALIVNITNGSPLAKAGVKSGDIITKFDNRTILDAASLNASTRETAPGNQIELSFIRDGVEQKITAIVGEK